MPMTVQCRAGGGSGHQREDALITLTCDKCDKPFEIEDDASGEKVSCPYCGDITRVPAAQPGAAAVSAATASAARTPPATTQRTGKSATSGSDPETIVAVVRQGMFRAHPFWYLLMVLVFLGGIVLAVLSTTMQQLAANSGWLLWVGSGMAALGVLWWLGWWAAPHRWVKLTITNKRTIRQEGIVMRKTSEVLHKHVTNVTIEQTLLGRLLDVGYIGIDSAGQGGEVEGSEDQHHRRSAIEIEVDHIPHPFRIKEIIDRYR